MMKDHSSRQSFAIHPYRLFVYLVIAAITALFLSLTIAYTFTRIHKGMEPLKVPLIFILNTLLLIGSSICLINAKQAFQDDKAAAYKQMLFYSIFLTLVFMVSQSFGWYQMFQSNLPLGVNNGVSYLYLISGAHFAHIVAGLPFLIGLYRTSLLRMTEPVSMLLYFSDPEKKVKLQLVSIYWHFLDILWIYLVVFFWINNFF